MKRATPYRPPGWPIGRRRMPTDRYPLGRNYMGPSYDWHAGLPRGLSTNECLWLALGAWAVGAIVIWMAYLFL